MLYSIYERRINSEWTNQGIKKSIRINTRRVFLKNWSFEKFYSANWNRNKKPSERTIFDICEKFNVNQDWLRTGNGEMFVELSKDEQISAMLGEIQRLGDENFKYRLVSALCKLSESDWTALENLVDMISDKK